mgnify:FL=1
MTDSELQDETNRAPEQIEAETMITPLRGLLIEIKELSDELHEVGFSDRSIEMVVAQMLIHTVLYRDETSVSVDMDLDDEELDED